MVDTRLPFAVFRVTLLPMPTPRPTPYDLAYGPLAEERFPRIRQSLAGAGLDPHDQDAFVLDREVVGLLRDLVPAEVGEAVNQHLALLHHAYLYWQEGGWLFRMSRDRTREMLAGQAASPDPAVPRAFYVQFPERLLWADLGTGGPPEPLDGLFVRPWPEGGYFVLGIFGLHPGREGFTVVDTDGHPEADLAREDGSPLFAPLMAGGEAAGLHSITGGEELIELAARSAAAVAATVAARGCTERHQPVEIA
jgi:hypothetical protein